MYEKYIKTGLLLEKKDGSRSLSVEFKKFDSHLHKFVVRLSSDFSETYWEWSFLHPVTAFSMYRKLSRYCFPKEERE